MKVGLLLITHDRLGEAMLETAEATLGDLPLACESLAVTRDVEPEAKIAQARAMLDRLDEGAGVLILTDMYGSTPGNVACALLGRREVRVVAGLNLPMLLRVFNYSGLNLDSLADKALGGGQAGVVACLPGGKVVEHTRD